MPPNAPRSDAPGMPLRLVRLLETTSQRLRKLAKLDPEVDPFTGSGAACEYVEEACCDLEKRGCAGAAQELRKRGAEVLEAAGTIVLPRMCKGDPDEIRKWSEHFGLPPIPDSEALRRHVIAFVGALGLMADYVDGVCDDLKEGGAQGGERAGATVFINKVENLHMGDKLEGISDSVVVNRSHVSGSITQLREELSPVVLDALARLERVVQTSGRKEANDHFAALREELGQREPRKSVLRRLWGLLVAAIPTIAGMGDIVETITGLFRDAPAS